MTATQAVSRGADRSCLASLAGAVPDNQGVGFDESEPAGSHAVFGAVGDAIEGSGGGAGNCDVQQRVRRRAPARISDLVDDNPNGPRTSDLHFW